MDHFYIFIICKPRILLKEHLGFDITNFLIAQKQQKHKGNFIRERSSLQEMKVCICTSGKLLYLWTYKSMETVYKGL